MVLPISKAELNSLETSSGSQIPDGSHRWPALEKSLSVLTLETGLPNRRGSVDVCEQRNNSNRWPCRFLKKNFSENIKSFGMSHGKCEND